MLECQIEETNPFILSGLSEVKVIESTLIRVKSIISETIVIRRPRRFSLGNMEEREESKWSRLIRSEKIVFV